MLRRAAIVLFLLVVSAAALFGARHLGVSLPWDVATLEPEPPSEAQSKSREEARPEAVPEASAPTAEQAIEETQAALGAPKAELPKPTEGGVTIDISRISADGASVFAGRAAPDSYVTVLEDGRPAGTAKTDAHGEWSLFTEHRFANTDPKLTYEVSRMPPEPETKTETAEAQTEAQPETQAQIETEPAEDHAAAASAEPAPESPPTASAAGDVMRKFENLVEAAREEAKQEAKQNEPASADGTATSDDSPDHSATASPDPAGSAATAARADAPEGEPQQAGSAANGTETRTAGEDTAADHESAEVAPRTKPEADTQAETRIAAAADTSEHGRSTQEPVPAPQQTDVIPVPIMFVYNEATLTSEGRRAAALLLEYLTLKKLDAVELTGHADERGSDAYNYELSRERLDAVAVLLKDGGYAGRLKLTPKGKSEPYMGVDRSTYTGEALYQLDRRVELRLQR